MDFKDTLKSQLNIVDVVGQYVRLKKSGAGARYIGLCPFHSEKTPSFGVNADHQYFKCFGCNEGGDVFAFVQKIEGATFPEAVKLLAERNGIPMPARARSDDPAEQQREALFEMQDKAAAIFEANLHGPQGMEARQYLASRGVSMDVARTFRLGLADGSGHQVLQRLKNYGPALLEESGLTSKREDGSQYDRFRSRLIFPIHDEAGRVIAFGGRGLRPDDKPKYLNSPATRLYDKSSVLYNLHRAKGVARKQDRMIVVEGYMDVIGVSAAGIQEVVAICGTAFSSAQVRLMKRQIAQGNANLGQVIMNLDPDRAGANAMEKSIAILLTEGLRVKVLSLPGDLDPDEFIAEHGIERYRSLCASAPGYFHWLADRAKERFDMHTAEGRVDAFQHLWPSIQQVHDRLERAAIANEVAESLGIDRDLVRERFGRRPQGVDANTNRVDLTLSIPPNERLLLSCLLNSEQARAAVLPYLAQSPAIALFTTVRQVFDQLLLMTETQTPFSFDALVASVEPRVQQILEQLAFSEMNATAEESTVQAMECLRALEAKHLETLRTDMKRRIRALEKEGNLAEAIQLTNELDRQTRASS
jgi:DNA primase